VNTEVFSNLRIDGSNVVSCDRNEQGYEM